LPTNEPPQLPVGSASTSSHGASLDAFALGKLSDVTLFEIVLDDSAQGAVELLDSLVDELQLRRPIHPRAEMRGRRPAQLGGLALHTSASLSLAALVSGLDAGDPLRPPGDRAAGLKFELGELAEDDQQCGLNEIPDVGLVEVPTKAAPDRDGEAWNQLFPRPRVAALGGGDQLVEIHGGQCTEGWSVNPCPNDHSDPT